jgi:hypothetical protein
MSVFLRQQKLAKGIYLSFVEAFYDSNKKNTYQKVIQKIGYLDDLKKPYKDPILFFKVRRNVYLANHQKNIKNQKLKKFQGQDK